MDATDVLAGSRYVLVVTFRKDGSAVPTPVWCAPLGSEVGVWSAPEAGKIKRVRRDRHIRIAPCTVRGRPRGALIDGTARVLEPGEIPALEAALVAKYGWQMRLTTFPDRLRGRGPSAGLAVSVPDLGAVGSTAG